MCKNLCRYLCCCFYYFEGSSDKRRDVSQSKKRQFPKTVNGKKGLSSDSSDSERYIKSSTETDFDRYKTGTIGPKKFRDLPKIQINFESPKEAVDDSIASHRIRLLERGFELQSNQMIGSGSFSQVFPVIRKSDQMLMACKISLNKEVAQSTSLSREVSQEVLCLNNIEPVLNIVQCFSQFIYDSKYSYIVMELSNGETLFNRMSNRVKPLTEKEANSYFYPIASAINILHTTRIAHRNLKLENVFIFKKADNTEMVKVSDYCTNRIALKQDKVVIYLRDAKTVTYMSPQILKFYAKHLRKIYKRSEGTIKPFDAFNGDIWALGVCLYYLLTKTPPYGLPPDPTNLDENMAAKEKFKFIEKCLQKMEENKLDLDRNVNSKLSEDCAEILNELLETKSSRRVEHYGVIQHKWTRKAIAETRS